MSVRAPDPAPHSMTPDPVLGVPVLAVYFFVLIILGIYGWHRYYLVLQYMKHRDRVPRRPAQLPEHMLPVVTVQLPIYNEMYVVDRLIDSVCAIDYPRDRLEIQ